MVNQNSHSRRLWKGNWNLFILGHQPFMIKVIWGKKFIIILMIAVICIWMNAAWMGIEGISWHDLCLPPDLFQGYVWVAWKVWVRSPQLMVHLGGTACDFEQSLNLCDWAWLNCWQFLHYDVLFLSWADMNSTNECL